MSMKGGKGSRLCHVAKRSELLAAEISVISDHTLRLLLNINSIWERRSDNVGGVIRDGL